VSLADTLDYADTTIGDLVGRTTVTGSDLMDAALIEVDAGGETLRWDGVTSGRDYGLGLEDISAIFHGALDGILPVEQAEAIEQTVRGLPGDEDAGALVGLLSRNPSRPAPGTTRTDA